MRKLIYFIFIVITFTSCNKFDDSQIWDKLTEHEERIEKLEVCCRQMNSNIESIQVIIESLQNNDYITNIQPLVDNGIVIGYTMTFSQSGTIVIYHGKDGKDGLTPLVGIAEDEDGIMYWTLDGEWLLDDSGQKVKAMAVDGKDGVNGTDGVTPKLKIENNYWYISYDQGLTWEELYKAVGEDGDSFFSSVTYDDYYVYIKLSDGYEITIPTKALIEQQQSKTSEVRLASRYDLVVGDTFQMFYTGVVKTFNVQNEGIRVVCEVGKQLGRYYEYTPNDSDAGKNYKLSITTRRLDGSVISSGETTLFVHPKLTNDTTPSKVNLLVFGASATAGGQWSAEGLRRIYGLDDSVLPVSLGITNTCVTYGTKNSVINGYSVYHEGYGGWTWGRFMTHNSENPFYNSVEDKIDFKYHAAKFANPGADIVAVLLTWNGANPTSDFNFTSSISNNMSNAAKLLKKIHEDFPLAKIICLGIQISSLNGGTGESYGATGGYSDPYATAFYAFDYNKALEELVTNEEFGQYCYYVDIKGQFDSEYNMPSKEVPVNNRNDSVTELVGSNGVHPTTQGYYQIGDAFYRALHRVLPVIAKSNEN